MTADDARRIALALPSVAELDHHGFPSWRVNGKIFATLPDVDHLHLMLGEDRIRAAVLIDPGACAEKWWGAKLAALRVTIAAIDEDVLEALLREAYDGKAPRRRGGG